MLAGETRKAKEESEDLFQRCLRGFDDRVRDALSEAITEDEAVDRPRV